MVIRWSIALHRWERGLRWGAERGILLHAVRDELLPAAIVLLVFQALLVSRIFSVGAIVGHLIIVLYNRKASSGLARTPRRLPDRLPAHARLPPSNACS